MAQSRLERNQIMKTLLRSLLVLTLTVSIGACTSTILGPQDVEQHGPDAGSHGPDAGSHGPDAGS